MPEMPKVFASFVATDRRNEMSTLIEVLDAMFDAIEDSSGPFCVWLRNYPGQKWSKTNLAEIRPYHALPYVSVRNKAYNECSLTDPNKKYILIPTTYRYLAIEKSLDMDGCTDIAEVYEKYFSTQKGE